MVQVPHSPLCFLLIKLYNMEKFLGVKQISAEVLNLGDYNNLKGWQIPPDENPLREGYLVKYEDGYTSWSPKEVFESAYRKLDNLTFGLAIEALKLGKCIARKGWNGNGMFIFKQVPSTIDNSIIPKMQSVPDEAKQILTTRNNEPIFYMNQMVIVKSDGSIDSWVASSSDTFSEDWFIL